MNTTQIPNEKNEVVKDYYNYATGESVTFMMTELLEKVSNDIYFPDIINIQPIYTATHLMLRITYLDYVEPAGELITTQTLTASIEDSWQNRLQLSYEWEAGETGRFTLQRFTDNKEIERITDYYDNIIATLILWHHDYDHTQLYTYGKWLADRLMEKSAIKALWF